MIFTSQCCQCPMRRTRVLGSPTHIYDPTVDYYLPNDGSDDHGAFVTPRYMWPLQTVHHELSQVALMMPDLSLHTCFVTMRTKTEVECSIVSVFLSDACRQHPGKSCKPNHKYTIMHHKIPKYYIYQGHAVNNKVTVHIKVSKYQGCTVNTQAEQ